MPILSTSADADGQGVQSTTRLTLLIVIGIVGATLIFSTFWTFGRCLFRICPCLRPQRASILSPVPPTRGTATPRGIVYPTSSPRKTRFSRAPATSPGTERGSYVEMRDSPSPLSMHQTLPSYEHSSSESSYCGRSSIAAIRGYPVVSVPAEARLAAARTHDVV
ncbi:hypothetical protein BN946_scf184970.g67 [Trametes cinnabarina]|uniref:Uncharacterized protein n=1 Tax=Pycnoporus cinnabarinus TaxID=5643 RepID=A0A060SCX8_PYCCI|nr:hypothetical protein BN946_scf184970.g67 [Trametes cinnabarina]